MRDLIILLAALALALIIARPALTDKRYGRRKEYGGEDG